MYSYKRMTDYDIQQFLAIDDAKYEIRGERFYDLPRAGDPPVAFVYPMEMPLDICGRPFAPGAIDFDSPEDATIFRAAQLDYDHARIAVYTGEFDSNVSVGYPTFMPRLPSESSHTMVIINWQNGHEPADLSPTSEFGKAYGVEFYYRSMAEDPECYCNLDLVILPRRPELFATEYYEQERYALRSIAMAGIAEETYRAVAPTYRVFIEDYLIDRLLEIDPDYEFDALEDEIVLSYRPNGEPSTYYVGAYRYSLAGTQRLAGLITDIAYRKEAAQS